MKSFADYREEIGEVGYLEEIVYCIAYISGLPGAQPMELVVFENGDLGQILSLSAQKAEILLFGGKGLRAGMQIARTNTFLEVGVGESFLGKTINPLGVLIDQSQTKPIPNQNRPTDIRPPGIEKRKRIDRSFETGVTLVDLIIPLGKGQRELIIGDRKTGKTNFLMQTMVNQAHQGTICIYTAIGKKRHDIKKVEEFFTSQGLMKNIIIIATGSEDPAGLIYLTPYTAMTVAEYFRDYGKDVLLVLDDLSTHAKFYREISLLGRRFPGRNSYPGDIFYTHAKLLERAGNFNKDKGEASITCLPVVETNQGDLSGYIQTNLMSMTDGHIYFDSDLFAKGRRPAINPFLSVTRVGRQTQTNLRREINRELISFMTLYEKMQTFVHFGAELSQTVKQTLATGDKILFFFDQTSYGALEVRLQVFLFCMLWIGTWQDKGFDVMQEEIEKLVNVYYHNPEFTQAVNQLVDQGLSFNELLNTVRQQSQSLLQQAGIIGGAK